MTPSQHRSSVEYLLGIDERHDNYRLLLSKALTALQMAKPVNQRAAEQIRAARKEITATLRRAA